MAVVRGAGRPKGGYYIGNDRVPGSTTITGRFKDPGGLYFGHWRNGKEGRDFGDWGGTDALAIGTQVHDAVEAFLHGDEPVELTSLEAISAYGAWREWWDGTGFTVVATEVPLVSERYRFGGTPDALLRDTRDRLCIFDVKTSKGLFPDYLWQIASYKVLWEENNPDEPITGGFHLGRFDKEYGDFTHKFFRELDDAERLFLIFREAYVLDKRVAKRAR